jgi:hypothetical protein
MTAIAISRMHPTTAPIAIPAFAPVESPSLSWFEDIGLDIGVLDGLFDCVFDAVVDNGADRAVTVEVVTAEVATSRCNDHVVAC